MATYKLYEDGYEYDMIEADSLADALEEAKSNVDAANYNEIESTIWVEVCARCEETDEEDSATVALDPDPPECESDRNHDWQSPHAILGGLEENPGVWGHGGGVIMQEVCTHCGCGKTTDTWAQNPENGIQGLTSVSYKPGKYTDEIEADRLDAHTDAEDAKESFGT
jgi:hypothetical protein